MKFMHVLDLKQFRLMLNGTYASIEYTSEGKVYNLTRTNVPEEYRGQGIARIIAEKTFKHIIAKEGKIQLSCNYLKEFYHRNRKLYEPHVLDE